MTKKRVLKLMAKLKQSFPADLDYVVSLDTTLAVSEGMHDILHTLVIALILVIIVVFIFLQGWRASLIPLLAVPVSLIGTFAFFPIFGFTLNTLSLLGLVLAIGLVVDDAIVVVEATERHIEDGMPPKAAALKAMHEVAGPVVSLALILAAVFIPTIFIPGITGRLYQQFALTIVISVMLSAFNALSLSPALAAMLLKPKDKNHSRGPLGKFYDWFNRLFDRARHGYIKIAGTLIRKSVFPSPAGGHSRRGACARARGCPRPSSRWRTRVTLRGRATALRLVAGAHGRRLQKDRGHFEKHPGREILHHRGRFQSAQPGAGHLQRLLFCDPQALGRTKKSGRTNRGHPGAHQCEVVQNAGGQVVAFSPPSIPGVGTSGGFTFMLEDRSGSQDMSFLPKTWISSWMPCATARNGPPADHLFAEGAAGLCQGGPGQSVETGRSLNEVYTTMQTFMGGIS